MIRLRSLALLLGAALLSACDENAVQDITGPMPTARVKFYNLAIGAPGVNFYANDTKLTAINTSACTPPTNPACVEAGVESTTGTNYGGVAAGGFYTAIAPGQYTLSGRIAAATDKGLVVSSAPVTIADGTHYTYYQTGMYDAATKSAEAFVVADDFPAQIDFSVAHVRFVNASPNANPMTLFVKPTTTGSEIAIGNTVAYKSASGFTAVPVGSYTLATRTAGATTDAITRASVSFEAGRVYTITARGDMTVTSTSATNRPFLDFTANR